MEDERMGKISKGERIKVYMRTRWMNECNLLQNEYIFWIVKECMNEINLVAKCIYIGLENNECTWLKNEYLLDEKRINKCMYLVAKWISNGWKKYEWMNVPGCKMNIHRMRKNE